MYGGRFIGKIESISSYVASIVENRKDEKFYLFVDEVQFTIKVKDEKNDGIEVSIYDMLNELKSYKNLDVYVTGSNSKCYLKILLQSSVEEQHSFMYIHYHLKNFILILAGINVLL